MLELFYGFLAAPAPHAQIADTYAKIVNVRRDSETLLPLEADILSAALKLRARDVDEWHGYALAEHMEDVDRHRATGYGTLYRTLARMEQRKLLTSRLESAEDAYAAAPPRPPRRMYRITGLGEGALSEWARVLPVPNFRPRLAFE